jgi:hypothetical protein
VFVCPKFSQLIISIFQAIAKEKECITNTVCHIAKHPDNNKYEAGARGTRYSHYVLLFMLWKF